MTDLAEFIARHGTPYDAETDAYRRPPFAAPIKAGKNTPIYNAHSYHTKVPPQGIVPYIEHYTEPGDLVLDPFCGSGMTGVACRMTGRHAILNDLSPAAVHIAYNYCTPVDVNALTREFERIKEAVKDEFEWLYGTTCDRCDGPATIQYTVWSDVFACARCRGEIVLWEAAVDSKTGKVNEQFACSKCGLEQSKRQAQWLRATPVVTEYECPTCRPKRGAHAPTAAELARIAEIEATPIPYWYPTTPFDKSWEMWRGVHRDQGITDVSKFFTRRNLWALASLWQRISEVGDRRTVDALRFVFTSLHQKYSRRTKWHMTRFGQASMPGTLYVPSLSVENHVLWTYGTKLRGITRALTYRGSGQALLLVGSASSLPRDLDGKIDYIFTDPPFGSNIFYADCNLLWESWLNQGLTDQAHEAVVHVKHKDKNTLPDYARLMAESFAEMHRVLKPGRWASVVFHNSNDAIWQTILDAAEAAGFELAEINSFDKEQLSFKGVRGAKGLERVTNKDIVLNLLKPGPRSRPGVQANGKAQRGNGDTEIRIVERIAEYLARNPSSEGRTLQALWNHALGEMIRNGTVEVNMDYVGQLLPYYFKQVDEAWYLRGQAIMGGRLFELQSDAGALVWLNALLAEPKTLGDLIPEWLKATAQVGGAAPGRLERLLDQNFYQDRRSGRWRIPTDKEREAMSSQADISTQAHLRVVRRFLAGELPHKPNAHELAAWIQFCYSREAYREAVQLHALLDSSQLDAAHRSQLDRIAAVCRIRAQRAEE